VVHAYWLEFKPRSGAMVAKVFHEFKHVQIMLSGLEFSNNKYLSTLATYHLHIYTKELVRCPL